MPNFRVKARVLERAGNLQLLETVHGTSFVYGVHGTSEGRLYLTSTSDGSFPVLFARQHIEGVFGHLLPKSFSIAPCYPLAVKADGRAATLKRQGITVIGDWEGQTCCTHTLRENMLVVREWNDSIDGRYLEKQPKVRMDKYLARRWNAAQQYSLDDIAHIEDNKYSVRSSRGGAWTVYVYMTQDLHLAAAKCNCPDYGQVHYKGVPVCKHVLFTALTVAQQRVFSVFVPKEE